MAKQMQFHIFDDGRLIAFHQNYNSMWWSNYCYIFHALWTWVMMALQLTVINIADL